MILPSGKRSTPADEVVGPGGPGALHSFPYHHRSQTVALRLEESNTQVYLDQELSKTHKSHHLVLEGRSYRPRLRPDGHRPLLSEVPTE